MQVLLPFPVPEVELTLDAYLNVASFYFLYWSVTVWPRILREARERRGVS